MFRRFENPVASRPYLNDPNYYRLGYQLAAQLMNSEAGGQEEISVPSGSDAFFGDFPRGENRPPSRVLARASAKRFEAEANLTLKWYRQRTEASLLTFPDRLEAPEQRLRQFLLLTVKPCLRLLIAASLRGEDDGKAERLVLPLREAAASGEISHRALYNLACFEVGGEEEESLESALEYLRQALEDAPGSSARELAVWARKDPSLARLHGRKEFVLLVKRFAGPREVK